MRLCLLLSLAACQTELDQRLAIITEPRVLAVLSDPAEGKPGETIHYAALVAGPDGAIADPLGWAFCTSPKSPTEDNAVSVQCAAGDNLIEMLDGPTTSGGIPMDACLSFGPDTLKPGFRPRDPDPSGGYYQPVRATVDGLLAFGLTRVSCDLANAAGDIAAMYRAGYVANANPVLQPLQLPAIHAGDAVALTASWSEPETFLYFDQLDQTLVTRREAMRVSYFATDGTMDLDAIARDEDDPETSATNTWHAPVTPGPQTLFLVLRDERGGIATQVAPLTVLPASD